ncbi:ArnT family glycosyltransferase [Vibrio lentus]|uniref:Glycosyltransferase RgtA/B/C/D-like domain-containing protein n=5 Tax=Vibrio lentus TaxID=136468 RepID=A0AA45ABB3_9VIBR|nr:hypothetical protein [Vibrio lentus]MCB5361868.1 hypothetical protein [Vibrio lentus]MCB5447632.1 hypothetical protein [Vibrio lentus]MCB5464258.1 hypothetical protein [Vibrio lentus]MCC5485610.1 hypothetical protein [Vibrio lentus]MCC5486441.1 hypothetical protein [Vibrio lentus]
MLDLIRKNLVPSIAILAFVGFSLIDISRPPVDLHQFRQTQTLSTIYNYFISGIDFLKPELDTNGSHSVIILEFPLYQALVAFFMKVFGYHEEIARLLNVFMIVCGGVALAKLSEQYIQKGTFSVVLIFFLFNPSILFWSSTTIIDPFVLGATLVSAYLLFRWYQSPEDKGKFYTAMFVAVIPLVTKLTVAFIIYFTFLVFIILTGGFKKQFFKLVAFGVVWLASIAIWMSYSKYWHGINPHVYTNGSTSWYLGTTDQRLNIDIYLEFAKRFIHNHNGIIVILLATIGLISATLEKNKKILYVYFGLILASVLYFVIFINLNYIHTYYQLPINITFSVLSGFGFYYIIRYLKGAVNYNWLICFYSVLAFALLKYNVNQLDHSWRDLSPITSPYTKSTCEYNIGNQVKDYLYKYNVDPSLLGVRLEYSQDCWNGEHALMYYLKERGYITTKFSDVRLTDPELDLIINIYKDKTDSDISGWNKVDSGRLTGNVNSYYFDVFTKSKQVEFTSSIELSNTVIQGNKAIHFNEGKVIEGSGIPPYSDVDLAFTVKGNASGKGFFLMRTYTGGYGADEYREFKIEEGESKTHRFNFITNKYDDYVIIFGTISDSSYEITSPLNLSSKPIFKAY